MSDMRGREGKGWYITTSGGVDWGKWTDDFKRLAEAFVAAAHGPYLQVWNEWRALYDTRAGHANNRLLARHRRRRHR